MDAQIDANQIEVGNEPREYMGNGERNGLRDVIGYMVIMILKTAVGLSVFANYSV